MAKFNLKERTKTVNLAGGRAFKMGAEMELIHAVLTTFLEDKFYESGNKRLERIIELVHANKPEFVANLAVIARQEFNLRSVSHVLIGELAKIHRGDDLVKRVIMAATPRPDDLLEIVSYVGTPIPKQVKRGVRNALLAYNRYQLGKYRGEGKSISMVDLFNLVHPKVQFANVEQKKAWKDLMEGKLTADDTWETELSNAKDDSARKRALQNLIAEDKMGYMALLRNLNNLIKYDVNEITKKRAIEMLTDPEAVKKSRQLPFRFWTAFENVQGNRQFTEAISDAMDLALSNTPELGGRTLIAVDSSGSMSGDPITKAAIFAATLFKANKSADVILYDTSVYTTPLNGRSATIDLATKIKDSAHGGGTQTSLVFDYARDEKYDRIVIISDNESWNEHSVQSAYESYKRISGTNPFVYAIDIQGYGTKDVDGAKVFHLTGWSDRLLDFIQQAEKGESMVEYVKNYELPNFTPLKSNEKSIRKNRK